MFTALVTHRLAVTKSAKATTTWPWVLQHLATCLFSHGGVVFKSLAMVAIVANTVYLGWAADHNDSWCEGLHIFSCISVQTSKTLKKKVNIAIQSIHITHITYHITHNACQPRVGTCTLCEVETSVAFFGQGAEQLETIARPTGGSHFPLCRHRSSDRRVEGIRVHPRRNHRFRCPENDRSVLILVFICFHLLFLFFMSPGDSNRSCPETRCLSAGLWVQFLSFELWRNSPGCNINQQRATSTMGSQWAT